MFSKCQQSSKQVQLNKIWWIPIKAAKLEKLWTLRTYEQTDDGNIFSSSVLTMTSSSRKKLYHSHTVMVRRTWFHLNETNWNRPFKFAWLDILDLSDFYDTCLLHECFCQRTFLVGHTSSSKVNLLLAGDKRTESNPPTTPSCSVTLGRSLLDLPNTHW